MSDQESETTAPPPAEMSPHELEKIEEAKLKAKYSNTMGVGGGPRLMGGHSAFLQKRLAKGQKYFDSGDYQMAKQKVGNNLNKQIQMKANCGGGGNNDDGGCCVGPVTATFAATGDAIPTPETVPARKTSIIQPSKFTPNVKCRSMSEGCVEFKKKQH